MVDDVPAPDPTPTETSPLDADALITDLFGSNRMGHEVESRFEEAYRDRAVRWSGEVANVRPYRGDRDFGNAPGTKATVLIGHLGDGRLVTSRVEAIVQLPAGVEPVRGTEITFTGTLLRVDRFMRNLYVAGATLASP